MLIVAAAMFGIAPVQAADTPATNATVALPEIAVYKTSLCGCCTKWVDHLEHSGLEVNVITVEETHSIRTRLGIPHQLGSCHTAVAGDYWVEGHVPADLIQQLLRDRPDDIQGIAVPGMPPGSPGMEAPNPVTYQVLSVSEEGDVAVYAVRQGIQP